MSQAQFPAFPTLVENTLGGTIDVAGQPLAPGDTLHFLGLSQRDYIATHLPGLAGPDLDAGSIELLTGKMPSMDMAPIEVLRLAAQAEAKLRYIRADAMLAARGEV